MPAGNGASSSSSSSSSNHDDARVTNFKELVLGLPSVTDSNQLQTALTLAIEYEEYEIAGLIRNQLRTVGAGQRDG